MPFRGLLDGEIVVPAFVPNRKPVNCLECGDEMYARAGKQQARHFYHVDTSAGGRCSVAGTGESDAHSRCVALAAATLVDRFESQDTRCGVEVRIELEDSFRGRDHRRADAVLEFESENPYFGKGVVVEVQHKNHEKDVGGTTHDYLSAGYSVVWLSTDEFDSECLDYSVIERAFQSESGSGYSVREHNPRSVIDCQSYHSSGEHSWEEIPSSVFSDGRGYEICTSPTCDVRRRYDEGANSYDYHIESGLPSYFRPKLLWKAIVRDFNLESFGRLLKQRYPVAPVEKALAARPEIEYCRGPKGFHEWKDPEKIWPDRRKQARITLRECRYCPVHLLANKRGYESDWKFIFFGGRPDPDLNLVELEENPDRCSHRSHDPERWYEYCPECGDTDP